MLHLLQTMNNCKTCNYFMRVNIPTALVRRYSFSTPKERLTTTVFGMDYLTSRTDKE